MNLGPRITKRYKSRNIIEDILFLTPIKVPTIFGWTGYLTLYDERSLSLLGFVTGGSTWSSSPSEAHLCRALM
jgi:hypothetical protein